MFIRVGYPTEQEEVEILKRTTGTTSTELHSIMDAEEIISLQSLAREVEVSDALLGYVARLVRQTRPNESQVTMITEYARWGAGPRAGQALILCAKARALLNRRFAVTLDDIEFVAPSILRHRVLTNFQAEADGISTDKLVSELLAKVAKPASKL